MVSAYLCKVSRHSTEGYMGILDCDHKLRISEPKYNTHKEKIKMNEKMKMREKLDHVVFSYFMKNSIHMAKG